MSKGSEFWGVASGKLGQQVLYRAGGEQRARAYVAKIKNPKTMAQMKNRILMNNVVSAFHGLKPLLQSTFPNRKSNQSAFNAFVSANKQRNQYYISKEDLEHTACVPYGMQISKGNLGMTIEPKLCELTNEYDKEAPNKYGFEVQGLLDLSGLTLELETDDAVNSVWYPTPSELFEVFKECSNIQLPSEFTLAFVTAPYGAEDEDLSTDLWQWGYEIIYCQQFNAYSRKYGIARNAIRASVGLHVSSCVRIGETNKWTCKFDKLVLGGPWVTPEDTLNYPVSLVLRFKDASGEQTLNSYMPIVPKTFDYEKIEDPTKDFVWGGFYTEQVLDSYGYKANSLLVSGNLNISQGEEESGGDEGGEDLTD